VVQQLLVAQVELALAQVALVVVLVEHLVLLVALQLDFIAQQAVAVVVVVELADPYHTPLVVLAVQAVRVL
jgi:hypothetical protein